MQHDSRVMQFPDDYGAAPDKVKPSYQVWLAGDAPGAFPAGYSYESDVRGKGLQDALRNFNETAGILYPPTRQATTGDVIVTPSGQPYRFEGGTFSEVEQYRPDAYAQPTQAREQEMER